MSTAAKRTYIIEPEIGEAGELLCDEESMHRVVSKILPALVAIGGTLVVDADRVKLGEIPGDPVRCRKCKGTGKRGAAQGGGLTKCGPCEGTGAKPGQPEPLSETVGFIVKWIGPTKLNDVPLTTRAMDYALGAGDDEGGGEQDLEAQAQAREEDAAAMEAALGETDEELAAGLDVIREAVEDSEPQSRDLDDDEDEECECEGDHVPPCPYAGTQED